VERQNKIVGVAGRKGSGKSTKAREILERCDRLFLFDSMGEHTWIPTRCENLDEATVEILESPYKKEFLVSLVPQGDEIEPEFIEVCGECYDAGNMMFAVEEVPMLTKPGFMPRRFNKMVRLGRHRNVSILYTAQRLSECPRALTSATDIFVLFCHAEPRDLDAIAERCGREVSEKVQNLGAHGFLVWDVLEMRELSTVTDEWYSACVLQTSEVPIAPTC
jgi:hypothetical protein